MSADERPCHHCGQSRIPAATVTHAGRSFDFCDACQRIALVDVAITTALPAGDVLRPSEVAELFRVEARTVSSWADAGKLAHFKTASGQRRFRRADVEALLRGDAP